MAGSNPSTPIAQRYDLLVERWLEFTKQPDARICCWLIESDELQMIEAFFDAETSFYGKTRDLFFKLITPFSDFSDYDRKITEELQEQIEDFLKANPDSNIQVTWKPSSWMKEIPVPVYFLHNFAGLAASLDFEALAVAYLFPAKLSSFKKWEDWLTEAIKAPIPPTIRLMVVAVLDGEHHRLEKLVKQFPEQFICIRPDLDMAGAMQEVAAIATDPTDPGAQFQMAFADLTQAANKGKMKIIEVKQQECLDLALKNDWPHLQLAVFFTVAAAFMGKQDYQSALQTYDEACLVGENMYETGNPLGSPLLIQALFVKASVLISPDKKLQNFKAAFDLYQKAASVAKELPEDHASRTYNLMEALRMMGHCKDQLKEYPEANQWYNEALKASESLPPDQRPDSTLPYIGVALIKLNPRVGGDYEEEKEIRHKLEALMGADWESKVITKKSKVS